MADDLDGLLRAIDAEVLAVHGRVSQVLRKTAFDIVATAQQLVPVDTGFLKGSIGEPTFTEGEGLFAAECGPTAEYGAYVEYGTHRHGPQPYMGPALDRHEPLMDQALGMVLGKDIG